MILSRVEESLRGYVTENPDADYAALIARFGSPRQIAESSLSQMEGSEILQCIRLGRRILYFLIVAVTTLFAVRTAFTILAYVDHMKAANGYAVVEVIEVDRMENTEGDSK